MPQNSGLNISWISLLTKNRTAKLAEIRFHAVLYDKTTFGVLLNSPLSQLGISATIFYMKNLVVNKNQKDNIPASFILFISRTSSEIEYVERTIALFIQNNFNDNFHTLRGTLGWCKENFRIHFSTGVGIPVISDKITFAGEITLRLIILRTHYSEINVWSRQKKSTNFTTLSC